MEPQLPTMTPQEFAGRWHDAGFGERQGAQSFFNDLCGLVGHLTPAAYGDPETYTFEKSVPGGFATHTSSSTLAGSSKGRTRNWTVHSTNCSVTKCI